MVWPNRGAAGPDSCQTINVLALLHGYHTVKHWLINHVTVEAKLRIKAEIGACLVDRDDALIVGDVVDSRPALRDGEKRRMGCGIDMQRRLSLPRIVPGAGAVQEPVAQHDAFDGR